MLFSCALDALRRPPGTRVRSRAFASLAIHEHLLKGAALHASLPPPRPLRASPPRASRSRAARRRPAPPSRSGTGITITTDEFKARLDEQSPFIRARYSTLERKKEFLDNLIRQEVLAARGRAAGARQGPRRPRHPPQDHGAEARAEALPARGGPRRNVPEAELQKYYDEHKAEYVRARKVRVARDRPERAAGTPDRAKKVALAKKTLLEDPGRGEEEPARVRPGGRGDLRGRGVEAARGRPPVPLARGARAGLLEGARRRRLRAQAGRDLRRRRGRRPASTSSSSRASSPS